MPRSLEEVLASVADVLFPADLGKRHVNIDSRGAEDDTPLHVMAWRNDLEAVELLLDAGADVNAVGDMGETPLHITVSQENVALIDAMIKAGARFDIRCEFGDTPQERAAKLGGVLASRFEAR